MADRLIIHYDGERAAWLDADGTLVRGTPADAGEAAAEHGVVVLVPAEDVLVTSVALPPIRQARRRLQAARFALEDQLVSRVDSLHFALAAGRADAGETPALVIDDTLMRQYLDALRTAGLDVLQMGPDALALPAPEHGQWQVAVLGDRVLARTAAEHAFAAELTLWPALAAGCEAPEQIAIRAGRSGAAETVARLEFDPAPQIEPRRLEGEDGVLAWLLTHADLTALINLRQGTHARTSAMQAWWQPLKITAALAAVWLVLAIGTRAVESWQLNGQIDALHAESVAAFHDAFPDVQTINDLRVQAEQRIRSLRGSGGGGGIFPLLQATAEVTGQAGSIRIQSLQYRDDALYLSLRGDSVQSVEALRAGFARQPRMQLTVESADAASDGVQIRASVSRAGA